MTTTFSLDADLLVGDISFATGQKDQFRVSAQNEIFAKLGGIYLLPLTPLDGGYEWLILHNIEVKIASGRLLMSVAAAGENSEVQAYAQYLLKEAMSDLQLIMDGSVLLPGCAQNPGNASAGNAPTIIQGDASSGVDAFYYWVNTPGAVPFSRGGAWWG